jgi:anti-sigma regulatory factor (Ser/Thr protein kinase)/ActR/RegA family two-component response regulator
MTAANPSAVARESAVKPAAKRILLIGKHPQLGQRLEDGLASHDCVFDYAAGSADALRHLRPTAYSVVITDPATRIEEDLALLEEMRAIRPGVRVIVLAPSSTPEEVIAALRARVFLCKSAPFDAAEIADYAARAATSTDSLLAIQVLSAHRDWVSVRMNCQMLTAERLVAFLKELRSELPSSPREELMAAFREILMNAIEHGAEFHPSKVVDVAAVHTERAIVFYVHDPGVGFRWEAIPHAAVSNPPDTPTRHAELREQQGMRPGGFGILIARGIVDELIYSEVGNEVLLIKHTA